MCLLQSKGRGVLRDKRQNREAGRDLQWLQAGIVCVQTENVGLTVTGGRRRRGNFTGDAAGR